MQVVAYYRVSTGKQEASGLGLEAQREYVMAAARSQGWEVVGEFTEAVSGAIRPLDRPECSKAFTTGFPVVVAKLDRLSRDVEHVAGLMKSHDFKVATMPTADTFQIHLFAALAEQERTFIRARTREALAALQARADSGDAEAQAKVERRREAGKKAVVTGHAREATQARVSSFLSSIKDAVELALFKGASTLQGVADALNAKGVTTARGGRWSPTQVSRVMDRLNLSFS
ncbi:TPA: recombinase family protein [Pseudomonas aeruginosa]|nr:recombinase family protein [Pseudomonas aeruginosa]